MVAHGGAWLGTSGLVLTPGEVHEGDVEDGQRGEPDGEVDGGYPVELVADERDQQRNQPRVRPELVPEDESDQDHLGGAVAEQVDRAEQRRAGREVPRSVQQVPREQVVRVLTELVRRQDAGQVRYRVRAHDEQQDSADHLQYPVQALEDQSDLERPVPAFGQWLSARAGPGGGRHRWLLPGSSRSLRSRWGCHGRSRAW